LEKRLCRDTAFGRLSAQNAKREKCPTRKKKSTQKEKIKRRNQIKRSNRSFFYSKI